MDDYSASYTREALAETLAVLATESCRLRALADLLVEKGILSREEVSRAEFIPKDQAREWAERRMPNTFEAILGTAGGTSATVEED